jgi:hypothetical protein
MKLSEVFYSGQYNGDDKDNINVFGACKYCDSPLSVPMSVYADSDALSKVSCKTCGNVGGFDKTQSNPRVDNTTP